MAYQTGTATDCNDLLDKFRLFAIAQGWTANRWVTAGSGRELCLQKGSAYFNFRSVQNENPTFNGSAAGAGMHGIILNGSDGYSGGLAWDRQPGYPVRTAGTLGSVDQGHIWCPVHDLNVGPFPAYHFFSINSGQALYCEWEVSTGTFQRFGIGSLDLFNPAAGGGGRFCYATGGAIPLTGTGYRWREYDIDNASWMMECVPFRRASLAAHTVSYGTGRTTAGSMVRAAFLSFDNWACSGRDASQQPYAWVCQGGGNHDRLLRDLSPAPLNGTAVLVPNIVSLNINNEFLAPIGQMPGLRFMDMSNYLPGDEFTLGTDTWKVFPWYAKGGLSFQRGIAFLKEA